MTCNLRKVAEGNAKVLSQRVIVVLAVRSLGHMRLQDAPRQPSRYDYSVYSPAVKETFNLTQRETNFV